MMKAMRFCEDRARVLQAIRRWKFGFPFPPILVALCGKIAFKKWVAHRKSGFCFSDNPLKTSGLSPPPAGTEWSRHEKVALGLSSCVSPAAFLRRPLPDLAESEP